MVVKFLVEGIYYKENSQYVCAGIQTSGSNNIGWCIHSIVIREGLRLPSARLSSIYFLSSLAGCANVCWRERHVQNPYQRLAVKEHGSDTFKSSRGGLRYGFNTVELVCDYHMDGGQVVTCICSFCTGHAATYLRQRIVNTIRTSNLSYSLFYSSI